MSHTTTPTQILYVDETQNMHCYDQYKYLLTTSIEPMNSNYGKYCSKLTLK